MYQTLRQYAVIALSIVGSATLLFSCSKKPEATIFDYETLMTESSENRTITMMENGQRSYTFVTPLMEGYSMATNPYQEFRRGIELTTYTSDSTNLEDATITANYAIYYENQKLWEAKGNVVIIKNNRKDGDTTVTGHTEIYTQQLFWNATTKKIYSNVDTKILQPDGWHFGVGFDADEDLKNIHFRKYSSEMEFDMSQPSQEEIDQANKEEEANKKESSNAGGKTGGNAGGETGGNAKNKAGSRADNRANSNRATENRSNKPVQIPTPPSSTPKVDNNRTMSPATNTAPKAQLPAGNKPATAPEPATRPNTPPKRGEQLSTSMNVSTDMGLKESDLNVDISPAK